MVQSASKDVIQNRKLVTIIELQHLKTL